MIREADIDGDGQVNYEGEFEKRPILSVCNPFVFRIRYYDDLKVIRQTVSLWKINHWLQVAGGGRLGPNNTNFHFVKNLPKFANFQFGQTPLRATYAKILHFSAFCLHVMPSLLPLSPLLGPMVSILEHLCLPKNTLNQILEKSLNIKNTKTLRCLCLKTFPVFPLFIFNN